MLNANGWLAWLVELSPAIAWAVFVFGLGDNCCFDCNTEDCCDGDVFPDELEVTIPDVFTTGNTGTLRAFHELTTTCDACGTIGGVYVLTHGGGGSYSYFDTSLCDIIVTVSGTKDCQWTVQLDISAVFVCDVVTGNCGLTVAVTIAVLGFAGTPVGGSHSCPTTTFAFNSASAFERTTWQLTQGESFGDCTARSWTVPWLGFQDSFGGDSDTTPSLCTSAGSGTDATVDQV